MYHKVLSKNVNFINSIFPFQKKTYWGKIPKITSNDATLLTPQCKTVTLQFSNHASFTPFPFCNILAAAAALNHYSPIG